MVRHIVWWTLKDEAEGRTAAENAKYLLEQSAMLKDIPGLLSIELSAQFLDSSTLPVQLILTSTHDDAAALQAYAIHPTHLQFGALIKPRVSSRSAIDYVIAGK